MHVQILQEKILCLVSIHCSC